MLDWTEGPHERNPSKPRPAPRPQLKMHEYRLYTTIPTTRKTQVLNILAGITASQPVSITHQTLIYQQLKAETAPAFKKGQTKPTAGPGQQQARLNHVKLVRDVKAEGSSDDGKDHGAGKWRVREEAIPDPAMKAVTSQAVVERELDDASMEKFKSGSEWYRYASQYSSSGVRFVHHNLVIYMTRLYTSGNIASDGDMLNAPPPALENANLLDPSGAWLVEVCVKVDDGGNTGLRDRATKELEGFKRELEGAVDLGMPDRLALDPRVK